MLNDHDEALTAASLQLNAIQESLRDAHERQASAIQKSRDNETAYINQIKALSLERDDLKLQIEKESKEKLNLSTYMQKEIQECTKVVDMYKIQLDSMHQEMLIKEKDVEQLRNERDSVNKTVVEKDKVILLLSCSHTSTI
jgi:predicted RNase H-like nuclease (RuvC/YqgF family)